MQQKKSESEHHLQALAMDENPSQDHQNKKPTKSFKLWLLILNCILVALGQVGGPLLLRLYYMHGGQRKWLTSWLQTSAFPILLIPLFFSHLSNSRTTTSPFSIFNCSPKLVFASAFIGFLFALDSYLYAFGLSYLPVSTSSLLMSTQTAFIAAFAFLLVRHKFSFYSVNSVILMTLGSVVLGVHANGDRPPNVSNGKYYLGFFMSLAAAALLGLIMPLIELAFSKVSKVVTYYKVMQMQFLVSMFATLYCTIAMIINKDFQALAREAREYGLGEAKYCLVLVWAAIAMQLMVIGNMGAIFCASSLFTGVFLALLVPVQQMFGVIFFHEKFNAEKGLALALCLWGFASYFYGEYKKATKEMTVEKSVTDSEHSNEV